MTFVLFKILNIIFHIKTFNKHSDGAYYSDRDMVLEVACSLKTFGRKSTSKVKFVI